MNSREFIQNEQVFCKWEVNGLKFGTFDQIQYYEQTNPNILLYIFISLFFCYIFLAASCVKKAEQLPDQVGDPPPQNCLGTLAQAEEINYFPTDNAWNRDISIDPLDLNNTQIISAIATRVIKADFGSGLWEGAPIGIPYIVVCNNQPRVPINFTDYGDESDAGPYPIPLTSPIEGNGIGDSHVIAVDIQNKKRYELFYARVNDNQWDASSGAVFDLTSNVLRTETWTSADAAGLPIFPGLVRYEEILKGEIDHPIRFTLTSNNVKPAYIHPARHKVNSTGGQFALPFGARIRLRADFDIMGFSAINQVILKAISTFRVPPTNGGKMLICEILRRSKEVTSR